MWSAVDKNNIITHFGFLSTYGFKIEFLSFEKDSSRDITSNATVALIHNDKDYFAIRWFIRPYEPKFFYKLDSIDELPLVFVNDSDKIIPVYNMDEDLWKKSRRKFRWKLFSVQSYDEYEVVSSSIKRQIEQKSSFYGISIHK